MNAADRRRLTPVLGVIAALLALLLIAMWAGLGRGARWHDDAAPAKLPPPAGETSPAPVVPPLDTYAEVWQHPLFSPTRTPEAVKSDDGAASGDLELTGVIMLPHLKMAIVHDKTTGKDYRVVAGQPSRDAPVLVELHPRSAVIESSGSRLQLHLQPGPSPEAENASGDNAQPVPAGNGPGSAMVSRPGTGNAGSAQGSDPDSTAARARALKARIEAQRRRARNKDGGQ